jgi:hypothetical protein
MGQNALDEVHCHRLGPRLERARLSNYHASKCGTLHFDIPPAPPTVPIVGMLRMNSSGAGYLMLSGD